MKKEEYRKALDNVKCSDEFRGKMEKMLSAPEGAVPEGYEDSVNTVDIAPKRSWMKITAAAAATVLVLGGAGAGAYKYFSNMTDEEIPPPVRSGYSTPFGDFDSMSLKFESGDRNIMNFGELPECLVKDITDYLNNADWSNVRDIDIVPDIPADQLDTIVLEFEGEEPFSLYAATYGEAWVNFEEKQVTYTSPTAYNDILGIVADNLISCDLAPFKMKMSSTLEGEEMEVILSEKSKTKITEILGTYSDSIERQGDTVSENADRIHILVGDRFWIRLGNGYMNITYNEHGTGVGRAILYTIPDEVWSEIYDALSDNDTYTVPWNPDEWAGYASFAFVRDGVCEISDMLNEENVFRNYLESLDWTESPEFAIPEETTDNEFQLNIGVGIMNSLRFFPDGTAVCDSYFDGGDQVRRFYRFESSVYNGLISAVDVYTGKNVPDYTVLVSDILKRSETENDVVYISDDDSGGITIPMDSMSNERFRDLIQETSWEFISYSPDMQSLRRDAFLINGFLFTRDGYVCDCREADVKLYSSLDTYEKYQAIIGVFEDLIKNNDFGYAQYLLLNPMKKYDTIDADIDFKFESPHFYGSNSSPSHLTGGTGELKYRKSDNSVNVSLKDASENHSVDYVRRGFQKCYIETGEYEIAENLTDYPDSYVDFQALRSEICSEFGLLNIHYKTSSHVSEGSNTRFFLNIELDSTRGWEIELLVDEYGTPLYYTKTEYDDTGSRVEKCRFIARHVTYDSPDFTLPELTRQQTAVLEQSN